MDKKQEELIDNLENETGKKISIIDNCPVFMGNIYLHPESQLPKNLIIKGDLIVPKYECITHPLPEGMTVYGDLYMSNSTITTLPRGLTVYGRLYATESNLRSIPDDIIVNRSFYLNSSCVKSIPKITVGVDLNISGTVINDIAEGLVVGHDFCLYNTEIKQLPERLTVVNNIEINKIYLPFLPEELKLGGVIYMAYQGTIYAQDARTKRRIKNEPLLWERDNGERYIKADGIFSRIESQRDNVYVLRGLGCEEVTYLVTDGNGHYAHGDTIKEAKADLIYKANDRDTSDYEGLTLDSVLTFEEAVDAYRTITGACSEGTRRYIENSLPNPHKETYTIREVIELTDGQYGSDTFKDFFNRETTINK